MRMLPGVWSNEATPVPVRRRCGVAGYNGTDMICVRKVCPAERLGLLRLGACHLCDGKEPALLVPRTQAPDRGESLVSIPCPSGFTGVINRTCTHDGVWKEELPLAGVCVRTYCPARMVQLKGWTDGMNATEQLLHSVPVPATAGKFASNPLRCLWSLEDLF